jgi:hypothetical protein
MRFLPSFSAGFLGLILVFFRIFFFSPPGAAQTSLEAELRNLEERIRLLPSSPARLEDLGRLAFLRELSGDIEGAASSWELASGGGRNSRALLREAACFTALGEWERAEAVVKAALLGGAAGEERTQAQVLLAQMEGLRSGGANTSALVSLLDDPACGAYRPRICFSLWRLTGRENWRRKLAEEFPRSPEGRIAAGADSAAGTAVTVDPSPLWLLFAARTPAATAPPGQIVSAGQTPPADRPAVSPPAPASPPPAGPPVPGEILLQIGLFNREANARALQEKLRAAGFSALSSRQIRSGTDYTVVYVRPGPDINRSIRDLRAAGFDSFPAAF